MADRTRFRLIESQVQQLQQFAERMQRSIDELQNELKSEKIESREQMKRVYENTEVKKRVASLSPYGKWVQENLRILKPTNYLSSTVFDNDATLRRQQAYGYYSEDLQMVIETMDSQGKEPTFCMGDDIPLAALPQRPHLL